MVSQGKRERQQNKWSFKIGVHYKDSYMWNDGAWISFLKPMIFNYSLIINTAWKSDESY